MNSAAAVLRLQYEAVLRAAWLLFAASPVQAEKLTRSLDVEAEQAAKNVPGYLLHADAPHATCVATLDLHPSYSAMH